MKKVLILIAALVLTFGSAVTSYSAVYEINSDVYFSASGTTPSGALTGSWGTVNYLNGYGDYVSWDHLFTFSPPLGTLVDAQLSLYLRDDSGSDSNEYAWVWKEDTGWGNRFEINTQTYGFGVNLGYLANQEYSVEIYASSGDFYIDRSNLWIKYEVNAVPEPMSLLLLGLGLLGIGGLARRK